MTLIFLTAFWAVLLWILSRTKATDKLNAAPALLLCGGVAVSLAYRNISGLSLPSELVASSADILLAGLAFAAAAQFRITKLAEICPASFRLAVGGAPLFLIICGLCAFIMTPQLNLAGAFLLAIALTLNGAAFDRRSVTAAPAPATIKSAVRLESAAILALGIPIAVILESLATSAPADVPAITPVYEISRSIFLAFAIGGSLGLLAARLGNRLKNKDKSIHAPVMALAGSVLICSLIDAHIVVAAAAAGLLWGEDTFAPIVTRVRIRRFAERNISPIAFAAFGILLGPRIFQGDLLSVLFALIAVSVLRAGPRYAALKKTKLPKQSQMFLAWFGGAPGAASALFLISLFDAPSVFAQDEILTVGALAVTFGVLAARLTSKPLVQFFLKESALARRREKFAAL